MAPSKKSPSIHPLQFITGTVVFTCIAALIIGVFTLGIYNLVAPLGEPYTQFFLFAVGGMALLISQEILFEAETIESSWEHSSPAKALGMAVSGVLVYNLVIGVSILVAAVAASAGAGNWALVLAFLYPTYDLFIGSKKLPFSVVGVLVWAVAVLYAFGLIGRTIVESAQTIELEPIRFIDQLRYRRPG